MDLPRVPAVLVVDDDPDLRMLLQTVLATTGARVLSAADGDSALELGLAHRPDVAVLDVMLPGRLDGLSLCTRLKAEHPGCFVIIVSGRGLQADVLDGERAGAGAYFVKPFSLLELSALIESVLPVHSDPPRRRRAERLRVHHFKR